MSNTTNTHQIKILIDQIMERDSTNCALAFIAIADKLKELYATKILNDFRLTAKLKDQIIVKKDNLDKQLSEIDKLEKLVEQNKDLILKEKKINEDYCSLINKKKTIDELQNKNKELNEQCNNFVTLDEKISDISLSNDMLVKKQMEVLNKTNTILGEYTTEMDNKLKSVIKVAKENLNKINKQCQETLIYLDQTPIQIGADKLDRELNDMILKYNQQVTKIINIKKELDIIDNKLFDLIEKNKKRIDVDKEIYRILESPEVFEKYINDKLKQIENFFIEFEENIKKLVDERGNISIPEIYKKQCNNVAAVNN